MKEYYPLIKVIQEECDRGNGISAPVAFEQIRYRWMLLNETRGVTEDGFEREFDALTVNGWILYHHEYGTILVQVMPKEEYDPFSDCPMCGHAWKEGHSCLGDITQHCPFCKEVITHQGCSCTSSKGLSF